MLYDSGRRYCSRQPIQRVSRAVKRGSVKRKKFPDARPRVISDNGPQFIARDFKEFIRISGMTRVKTSPYYPQSNGKPERCHRTIKGSCIRVSTPLTPADAIRLVTDFVDHYDNRRLHIAIGYITPADKLQGRAENDSGSARSQAYRRQRGPESSAETTGLVMKR